MIVKVIGCRGPWL